MKSPVFAEENFKAEADWLKQNWKEGNDVALVMVTNEDVQYHLIPAGTTEEAAEKLIKDIPEGIMRFKEKDSIVKNLEKLAKGESEDDGEAF